MLRRFARWFASAPGVWQTGGFVLLWYAAEALGLVHDEQHFQLLLWLTIYSGITQPVLAYVNKQEGLEDDQFFQRIEELEKRILDKLDN